jgi:hypothetical protein
MSQLIQSACPGCKKRLRIPVEWLHQPIRCKYCGMVLQAKQQTSSTRNTPVPPKKDETPLPAAKLVVPPPDEPAATRPSRRRRKSSGWWKGPALALAVFGLVLAGFGVYLHRDRLATLLPPDDEPTGRDNRDNGTVTKTTAKTAKLLRSHAERGNEMVRSSVFPRRALVISVHDYLYANPLQNGMPGPQANNLENLTNDLSFGLHIPLNQMALLSDDAGKKWGARAPTKTVIEKTLTNFLDSSRAQDRILVFFFGHAVELGDEAYLAPIEGELDRAETLIPLKWIYEQLAKCKARQKVLVLDGNRYHQTFGQERPGGEEMGPKLDAMLKSPPDGVQVWSSCIAKERSFASDDYPMGVFLASLQKALRQGGRGKIQKAEEALPLEHYVNLVNQLMKNDLSKRKLEQVSRLSGKEPASDVVYDPKQPPAPEAKAGLARPAAGVEQNKKLIEAVLDEIGTPPIKVTHEMPLRYDALPPFPAKALQKYQEDAPNPNSPLREAVKKARAVLWAIYPGQAPSQIRVEVTMVRRNYNGVQLNILKDGYRAPGGGNGEKQFKDRVETDERHVAMLMRAVEDALNELRDPKAVEARESESKRWQANYDFMLARVELEYAYLFEYQSMLGSMRKEFPPLDPQLHGGWKLASQARLQGDSSGKKAAKEAQKLLDKIIKSNAGTPWEVLAKREKLTNLGLEWQPAK